MTTVSDRSANLACATYYKDKNHHWTSYPTYKIEEALREYGYIIDGEYYKKYDADKELLIFVGSLGSSYDDWNTLVFRLKIANWFYKKMKWCYEMFRPV